MTLFTDDCRDKLTTENLVNQSMVTVPSDGLQFSSNPLWHSFWIGFLAEAELFQNGGLLPLDLLGPERVHQMAQELVGILLLETTELGRFSANLKKTVKLDETVC